MLGPSVVPPGHWDLVVAPDQQVVRSAVADLWGRLAGSAAKLDQGVARVRVVSGRSGAVPVVARSPEARSVPAAQWAPAPALAWAMALVPVREASGLVPAEAPAPAWAGES